jgi:hypothetical protein
VTRESDEIERVLKECSKKKGLVLLKDLLTKIEQRDELSNVLQVCQFCDLGLFISVG